MNEEQLRQAVKTNVLAKYAQDQNTRVVEEMAIHHGAGRIDIAVINGTLHGFELKSDLDSLRRLPRQIELYGLVFDRLTLVTGRPHLKRAEEILPEWWGIKAATINTYGHFEFEDLRKSLNNPSVNSLSLAKLLWRNEALTFLEEIGHADGVRHKSRALVYDRLVNVLDLASIQAKVRLQLKSRTGWRVD